MNEMKPEDVMRALEWCSNGYDCKQCFLYGTTRRMESCMAEMMKKALALLREKDAEIERLTKERDLANAEREANVKGFTAEIARMAQEVQNA